MFETNSSSVHSFIVPKESKSLKIPKSVKLYGMADPTTPEGRIQFMYDLANDFGFADDFKIYLKSKGIHSKRLFNYNKILVLERKLLWQIQ
jgi:hypothetical protein